MLLTHPNCNRATDWSKVAAAGMPVRDVEKDKSCLSVAMLFDERWGWGQFSAAAVRLSFFVSEDG